MLSNPRKTYVPRIGCGFLPNETAKHHQRHVVHTVKAALLEAGITGENVSAICYTKGPGMVGPLKVVPWQLEY